MKSGSAGEMGMVWVTPDRYVRTTVILVWLRSIHQPERASSRLRIFSSRATIRVMAEPVNSAKVAPGGSVEHE